MIWIAIPLGIAAAATGTPIAEGCAEEAQKWRVSMDLMAIEGPAVMPGCFNLAGAAQ